MSISSCCTVLDSQVLVTTSVRLNTYSTKNIECTTLNSYIASVASIVIAITQTDASICRDLFSFEVEVLDNQTSCSVSCALTVNNNHTFVVAVVTIDSNISIWLLSNSYITLDVFCKLDNVIINSLVDKCLEHSCVICVHLLTREYLEVLSAGNSVLSRSNESSLVVASSEYYIVTWSLEYVTLTKVDGVVSRSLTSNNRKECLDRRLLYIKSTRDLSINTQTILLNIESRVLYNATSRSAE